MLERLLRVENLVVVPLLAIVVLVALGARWRNDPRRGYAYAARVMRMTVGIGLVMVVAWIVLFFAVLALRGPVGP